MALVYPRGNGGQGQGLKYSALLLAFVALASIVSVVSVILSAVVWQMSRSYVDGQGHGQGHKRQMGSREIVCLPCEALIDGNSSMEERMLVDFLLRGSSDPRTKTPDPINSLTDDDVCCAKDEKQLKLLLKMFLNVQDRKENKHEVVEDTSCLLFPSKIQKSANETLCTLDKMEDANSIHLFSSGLLDENTLLWDEGANVLVGVAYNHGRVLPNSDGIYFVYSQVYFVDYGDQTSSSQSTSSESTVTLFINRHNNQTNHTDMVIERTQQRCSKTTIAHSFLCQYSVSAGSLVQLKSGDAVFVNVSHPSMVNFDSKFTYFGLYEVT